MRTSSLLDLAAQRRISSDRPGYVLLAVLIVIVVLSLIAYQFTELMTSEYKSSVRTTEAAQARANAISGIHYTVGMLSDSNSLTNLLAGNPYNNTEYFQDIPVSPDTNNLRKQGRFSIIAVVNTGTGLSPNYQKQYGVVDEGGKLNINALIQIDPTGQVLYAALMQLQAVCPNMTTDLAAAIVDWVDADINVFASADGTGTGYEDYSNKTAVDASGNTVSYQAKNGPLNTLDELLLVNGMTPQILYGNDRNRNGMADDDPNGAQADRGLADYITIYGRELNIDSNGSLREYLNDSEDMNGLYQRLIPKVGQNMADYILAYKLFGGSQVPSATPTASGTATVAMTAASSKTASTISSTGKTTTMTMTVTLSTGKSTSSSGSAAATPAPATDDQLTTAVTTALPTGKNKKSIKSAMDFLNTQVTLPVPTGSPAGTQAQVYQSPLNDPSKVNQLLPLLLDMTTAKQAIEMIPRLNLNTAPAEVLLGLPGIAQTDVDNIISARANLSPTDPGTQTAAWIVTAAGVSPTAFAAMEQFVTGRTMVYRIHSLGYFGEGGLVARAEAVIDTNQGAPRFLYYRDMSELDNPRGFVPERK